MVKKKTIQLVMSLQLDNYSESYVDYERFVQLTKTIYEAEQVCPIAARLIDTLVASHICLEFEMEQPFL